MKYPRHYQETAKSNIYQAWEYNDIVFLQLATGGGKTVIFSDVVKDFILRGKRVKLIAHREELIGQADATLRGCKILPGIIKGSIPTNYSLPAQVCSIQTIARRDYLPDSDLIVIDEGHHVTADNSYGKILKRYPNAKVLIVSATPYRLSGEGFENIVPGKITKLVMSSSTATLIDDGYLVPFKLFAAHIPDLSKVSVNRKGDYEEEEAHQAMKLAPVVDNYLEFAAGKQGITFATRVQHSIDLVSEYWSKGVPAHHLDANTPDEDYYVNGTRYLGRKSIISDFNCQLIKVVSNVGILTEGTDFPNCEFVQDAAPTKSLSKHLQKIGRGTRPISGLVDNYATAKERREAIAASVKPHCILLDCCGGWIEHGMPDAYHPWEEHFKGKPKGERKKKKEELSLDMFVYVAEDLFGNIIKTHNAKEIEGLRLIEVTKEVRTKLVNIKALKEFDHLYKLYCSAYSTHNPGKVALRKYIEYCEKHRVLMVPQVWEYLQNELVAKVILRKQTLVANRAANQAQYPDSLFNSSLARIEASGVSTEYLLNEWDKYAKRYRSELMEHANSRIKENV